MKEEEKNTISRNQSDRSQKKKKCPYLVMGGEKSTTLAYT